eukprot:GHVH01014927.1.p1 GENE.GHVH01014927.1~~GHVH01014927.1.p1  ORF type:complete len:146 (+),score=8.56 GHVH01014927.1:541-978(+)
MQSTKATPRGKPNRIANQLRQPKRVVLKDKRYKGPEGGGFTSCWSICYFCISVFAIILLPFWGYLLLNRSMAIQLKVTGPKNKPHAGKVCIAAASLYCLVMVYCAFTVVQTQRFYKAKDPRKFFSDSVEKIKRNKRDIEVPLIMG